MFLFVSVLLCADIALQPEQGEDEIVIDRGCAIHAPPAEVREAVANELAAVRAANRMFLEDGLVVEIPVWIHVITANGVGSPSNEQLDEQIEVLNNAFSLVGFQFFVLGRQDIDEPSWHTMGYKSPEEKAAKSALWVDGALNLYLCSPPNNLLGWATWPWDKQDNPKMDGVVVHYQSLPNGDMSNYNLGMTTVHEVGHFLGLYHTFQGGCAVPGDEVEDTPYQASPSNGCPMSRDSCLSSGLDPVDNFMDYSYDLCMNTFTPGQAERMHTMVATYRSSLITPSQLRLLDLSGALTHMRPQDDAKAELMRPLLSLKEAMEIVTHSDAYLRLDWGDPVSATLQDGFVLMNFHTPLEEQEQLGLRTLIVNPEGSVELLPRR